MSSSIPPRPPLLEAQGLTMSYPGVKALGGVDFDLRPGEIHALCGENGAGKSTLIKILCGVIPTRAHGGTVSLDGATCRFMNPGDALRAGVRVIHQELALCPDLSVAENVFLGEEIMWRGMAWGVPDTRRMVAETRTALDALGLRDVDPAARVGGLPVGLRQMIEIARALKPTSHSTTHRDARSPQNTTQGGPRRGEGERGKEGEEARLGASQRSPTTQRDARSPQNTTQGGPRRSEGERGKEGEEARLGASQRSPTTHRDARSPQNTTQGGPRRSEGERGKEGEEARLGASQRSPTTHRDARSPAKVLILDEPTSALSSREAERLLATLQRLRADGMAILYISHRLDEVFRLADRITVLRSGESVGTLDRASDMPDVPADASDEADTTSVAPFNAARVVAMMTGTSRAPSPPASSRPATPPPTFSGTDVPLLSVRDWTLRDPANPARLTVDRVSFDLRPGEVLGFAGLMGAGRTELMESLCGLYPAAVRGTLHVEGAPYVPRDAAHAQRHGIALVCEDRRARGLFADKSVRMNMTISALRAFCSFGWITHDGRTSRERVEAQARIDALRIKTPGTEFIAGNLSGGNQQKALIARALLTRPKILILDEPTRGIDVGAKEELYALIETLAANGLGILLVSSETEEVLRLAHRVIVLRGGRVADERPASTLSLEETLALAAGGTPT